MKIYRVSFNDGGWHSSRPEYQIVAESKEDAIEKVLIRYPHYRNGYDSWAKQLDKYFKNWLEVLGVSEDFYNETRSFLIG